MVPTFRIRVTRSMMSRPEVNGARATARRPTLHGGDARAIQQGSGSNGDGLSRPVLALLQFFRIRLYVCHQPTRVMQKKLQAKPVKT